MTNDQVHKAGFARNPTPNAQRGTRNAERGAAEARSAISYRAGVLATTGGLLCYFASGVPRSALRVPRLTIENTMTYRRRTSPQDAEKLRARTPIPKE